jgi:hypothetical protein
VIAIVATAQFSQEVDSCSFENYRFNCPKENSETPLVASNEIHTKVNGKETK